MPGGGGLQTHDDTKHKGSAKRDTNNGVVAQGAAGQIRLTLISFYAFLATMLGNDEGSISVNPGASGALASIGVNCYYADGAWYYYDDTKPCFRVDLDADNDVLKIYHSPAGPSPPGFRLEASYGRYWSSVIGDLGKIGIKEVAFKVTVPATVQVARSASNALYKNKFILGITYKVTQEPGGGAGAFDIGSESDNDAYGVAISTGVGTAGTSMDTSATAPPPAVQSATEKIEVACDAPVTGASLIIDGYVTYIDMTAPP